MSQKITDAIKQRLQNLEDHKPDSPEQYKAAFNQAIDDINALLNLLDALSGDDYPIGSEIIRGNPTW